MVNSLEDRAREASRLYEARAAGVAASARISRPAVKSEPRADASVPGELEAVGWR